MKMHGMRAVGIRFGEMTMIPCLTYEGMRIRRFHNYKEPHRSACGCMGILIASTKNSDSTESRKKGPCSGGVAGITKNRYPETEYVSRNKRSRNSQVRSVAGALLGVGRAWVG